MELALIPPSSMMYYAGQFKYQMMLPSPQNINYLQFYLHAGPNHNYYVILDNGVWENDALTSSQLLAKAWRFKVQEIVLPDVLNNPDETLDRMRKFLKVWDQFTHIQGQVQATWSPTFMAVAHGDTLEKAARFIDHVADKMPIVKTIAAGRAFSRACRDDQARAKLAMWVADEFPDRFEFHMLGYNDAWSGEIGSCKGVVRSLDTCAPFTAAHYGKGMKDIIEHNTPRPPNYFDMKEDDFDLDLLGQNVRRLRESMRLNQGHQVGLRDVSPTWPPATH